MIIGITGIQWSGKSTCIDYIMKNYDFQSFSLSDMIRQQLRKENRPINRDNLQKKWNEMRKAKGAGVLAQKAIQKVQKNPEKNYIIDSIRNPKEIQTLQNLSEFVMLGIQADMNEIIKRIKKRNRDQENNSEEIQENIKKELYGKWGKKSQRINDCLEICDILIENNDSLKDFYKKIDETLEKINWKI